MFLVLDLATFLLPLVDSLLLLDLYMANAEFLPAEASVVLLLTKLPWSARRRT